MKPTKWSMIWPAIAAVALLALAPTQAPAQELWRGAMAGMTMAEVQVLHPQAVPGSGDTLNNGARSALRLEGFEINRTAAEADFFFLEEKLHQVVVRPLGLRDHATASNIALARTLSGLITQRYGEPYECGTTRLGFSCSWNANTLNIALVYMDIFGRSPLLNINYRPKPNGLDDNL